MFLRWPELAKKRVMREGNTIKGLAVLGDVVVESGAALNSMEGNEMKRALFVGIVLAALAAALGGCTGTMVKGPLPASDLRGLGGAGQVEGLAIVLYYETASPAQARMLYDKLLGLGMRDTLFEPGLGEGGPRAIMYRAALREQAEWLKAHVWELKDFALTEDKSATDIYINAW